MYFVHRRYLVGLALAVVVAAAAIVVPKVTHAIHNHQVNAEFAAGERTLARAFKRLRVPGSFVPVRAGSRLSRDCLGSCYRVEKRSRAVAKMLPAMFASIGIHDAAQHGSCAPLSGNCQYSVPIQEQPVVEAIDVSIQPLLQCQSLSPQRGCRPTNASLVWIYG